MKRIKFIFLIISIIFLCLVILIIIDTYISLKYEIEEIYHLTDTVSIDLAKQYLLEQIEILYYLGSYIFITIVFILFTIFKK